MSALNSIAYPVAAQLHNDLLSDALFPPAHLTVAVWPVQAPDLR